MIEAAINTAALAVVAWAALVRIKELRRNVCLHSIGVAIILGGAIGSALEWYWPAQVRPFHIDTLLDVGLGLVALDIVLEHLRTFRAMRARRRWRSEFAEAFNLRTAKAIPGQAEEFLEQRFSRRP